MSAGGGDAVADDGAPDPNEILCTICLDAVIADGDRSWARLICGHKFHLDCIGREFFSKREMQCPNCRRIENRTWPFADFVAQWGAMLDDWLAQGRIEGLDSSVWNEDTGLAQVNSRPSSGSTRLPTSFDGGEISSSTHHNHPLAVVHEPSTNHPSPYSALDGSTFGSQWTGPAFPQHNSMRGPSPPPFRAMNRTDPHRYAAMHRRNSSEIAARSAFQPFVHGHRPNNSAVSSSSTVRPGPQTYTHNSGRRSSSHRGSAHRGSSQQQPSSSSATAYQQEGGPHSLDYYHTDVMARLAAEWHRLNHRP